MLPILRQLWNRDIMVCIWILQEGGKNVTPFTWKIKTDTNKKMIDLGLNC